MSSSSVLRVPLLLALAACAIAATPKAHAQAYLDQRSQGSGVCKSALPSFEGLIRNRPLALQNEGSATAFVTCAIPQFNNSQLNDPDYGVQIFFLNSGTTAATINCTGVSFADDVTINYVPQSISVPAGVEATAFSTELSWDERDANGSGAYTTVSCGLPPGTGISTVISYAGAVATPTPAAAP